MKKIYAMLTVGLLSATLLTATATTAQNAQPAAQKEQPAQRLEKRKAAMAQKLSALDQTELKKRKKGLEARLAKETDAKKKADAQLRLEVINSLIK